MLEKNFGLGLWLLMSVSQYVILDSEFNGFREGGRRKRLFGQYCVLFHLPQNRAGLHCCIQTAFLDFF